jgi:hypothetical protein
MKVRYSPTHVMTAIHAAIEFIRRESGDGRGDGFPGCAQQIRIAISIQGILS